MLNHDLRTPINMVARGRVRKGERKTDKKESGSVFFLTFSYSIYASIDFDMQNVGFTQSEFLTQI